MSEILFIHGFGTRVTGRFSEPKNDVDAGFGNLIRERWIEAGVASVFRWGIACALSNELNPISTKNQLENLYRREKSLTANSEFLRKLHAAIETIKPKVIIAHSMGCHLTLNYLHRFGAPQALKQIIFTQADVPNTTELGDLSSIQWTNIYMRLDPSLHYSQLLNGYTPAGIAPMTDSTVKNIQFSYTPRGIVNHIRHGQWNVHDQIFANPEYFAVLKDATGTHIF